MIAVVNNNPNDKNPIGISYTDGLTDYIDSPHDNVLRAIGERVAQNTMFQPGGHNVNLNPLGDPAKYERIGIAPSVPLLNAQAEGKLDKALSEEQSGWQKLRNSLGQTIISEVGLGTLKAMSDTADFLLGNIFKPDNDYSNPVSQYLGNLQESFKELAPIYTDPEKDIFHGGMATTGWWLANLPSIASSITLFVPGMAITKAVGWLSKIGKIDKAIGKTRRFLTGTAKLKDGAQLNKFQAIMNNPINVARMNAGFENLGTASVMRIAENYQEARQSYEDVYKTAVKQFDEMDDNEYANWLNTHQDLLEESGLDGSDKDALAKFISKRAADRTFIEDAGNLVFDFIQLQGLRSIGKLKGKVDSASIRAAHRASINNVGKTAEEIAKNAATKPERWRNALNWSKDFVKGSGKMMLDESTEGIEEAVNYVAQQEGIAFGKSMLGVIEDENGKLIEPEFKDRLWTYIQSPQLVESAFWGWMGGIVFGGLAGSYNTARRVNEERKANEARRAGNDKTKERPQVADWFLSGELPEVKAARASIINRNDRLNTLSQQIQDVDDRNLNPFDIDENGQMREFGENATDFDKEYVKQKLREKFIQDVTLDAVNSGTYDLLEDWSTNDKVKQAFKDLGVTDNGDEFSDFIVKTMKKAKDTYTQQLAHVGLQMTAINAARDKDLYVSPEFTQLIAYDNTQRLLQIDRLDEEINTLEVDSEEQKQISNKDLDTDIDYKQTVEFFMLADSLAQLDADKRAVKDDTSLSPIEKERKLKSLSNEEKNLALYVNRQLGSKPSAETLGMILQMYRWRNSYVRVGNQYVGNPALNVNKLTDEEREAIDKSIIEEHSDIFGETNISLDSIKQMANVFSTRVLSNKVLDQLKNANQQLYNDYVHLTQLKYNKIVELSKVDTTQSAVLQRVDDWNNVFNKARANAIADAGETIIKAYMKYKDDETRKGLENVVVQAYKNNRNEAARLAEELFDTPEEAADYINALDILNLSSANNTNLYDYISNIIGNINEVISSIESTATQPNNANSSTGEPATQPEEPTAQPTPTPTPQPTPASQPAPVQPSPAPTTQSSPAPAEEPAPKLSKEEILASLNLPPKAELLASTQGNYLIKVNNLSEDELRNFLAKDDTYYDPTNFSLTLDAENTTISVEVDPVIDSRGKVVTRGVYSIDYKDDYEGEEDDGSGEEVPFGTLNPVDVGAEPVAPLEEETAETETPATPTPEEEVANLIENIPQVDNSVTGIEIQPIQDRLNIYFPSTITNDTSTLNKTDYVNNLINVLNEEGYGEQYSEDELRNIVEKSFDNYIEQINALRKFNEQELLIVKLSNETTHIDNTLSAKIEEVANPFTESFVKALRDVVKHFADEMGDTPLQDGRIVLDLQTILAYVEKIPYLQTQEQKDSFYNVIKQYILTDPDAKRKYVIRDIASIRDDSVRLKAAGIEVNEDNPKGSSDASIVQVDIKDITDRSILNNLSRGDVLESTVIEGSRGTNKINYLVLTKNGEKVGVIPFPVAILEHDEHGNNIIKYSKYNHNIRWDIVRGNDGTYKSEAAEFVKKVFTSEEASCVAIRKLLNEVMANDGVVTSQHVEAFKKIPLIDKAEIVSIAKYKNARDHHKLFEHMFYVITTTVDGKKTEIVDSKKTLEGLYALYNGINYRNATTKAKRNEVIKDSIDSFVERIYTSYDSIINRSQNISAENPIRVEKVTKGAINLVVSDNPKYHYDELNPVSKAVKDRSKVKLAVVVKDNNSPSLSISGRNNVDYAGNKGQTGIVLDPDSERPTLVAGYGVHAIEFNQDKTSPLNSIVMATFNHTKDVLISAFISNDTNAAYNAVKSLIEKLIPTYSDAKTLPLFRATDGSIKVNEFMERTERGIFSGIEICKPIKNFDGTTSYKTMRFYNRSPMSGDTFGYRGTNGKTHFKRKDNYDNQNNGIGAARDLMTFIAEECSINIDIAGINSDNNTVSDFGNSFFTRNADGSITVNIPHTENANGDTGFNATYKSYNDFILNNDLIRVNTFLGDDKSNYNSKNKDQRKNQVFYVRIPKSANSVTVGLTEADSHTVNKDKIAKNSDAEKFTSLHQIMTDSSDNKMGRVLDKALDNDDKVLSLIHDSELIPSLFPSDIQYVDNFNSKDSDVAATRVMPHEGKEVVTARTKNGTSYKTKFGRVTFGDRMLNKLSSRNRFERYNALSILIHERIHAYVVNNPNYSEKEIIDAITPVYKEFSVQLEKDYKEFREDFKKSMGKDVDKATVEEIDHFTTMSVKYVNSKNGLGYLMRWRYRYRGGATVTNINEFLAESLTSPSFISYLNSIKTTDVGTHGEKTLFDKIIDFICGLFGLEVENNSLLKKEINALSNIIKPTEIENQVGSPVEDSVGNNATSETPAPANNNTQSETPSKDDTETKSKKKKGLGGKNKKKSDTSINASLEETFDFTEDMSDGENITPITTISHIPDVNLLALNDVTNSIPLEDRGKFDKLVNDGEISIICH